MSEVLPGKLKRKAKRSSTSSVVDLPALHETSSQGSLLGSALIEPETPVIPEEEIPAEEPEKPELKVELPKPSSPLDLLKVEEELDQPKPDPVKPALRKKTLKPKAPAPAPVESDENDVVKLQTLLSQSHDINQKCLDTLAKMQNTNVLNERRYALYLTIAFSILAVVVIIGVYMGVNMHTKNKDSERRFKQESVQSLSDAKAFLEKELEKEEAGKNAAMEVFQLIEHGLFKDAVEKYTEVRGLITHHAESALLEQRIDEIRWKLAENAYHDGRQLFDASNFEQARDLFLTSLFYKENTAYTPRLNYYLAMSLFQLNDFEGARLYFARINPSNLSSEMEANARYHHAVSAEKLGNNEEAYEQYDQFLKKFRYHWLADKAVKGRARVDSARTSP